MSAIVVPVSMGKVAHLCVCVGAYVYCVYRGLRLKSQFFYDSSTPHLLKHILQVELSALPSALYLTTGNHAQQTFM